MTETQRIDRIPALWLLATVIATAAPHIAYQPAWLSALCAALIGWQAFILRYPRFRPPTFILVLIGIAVAGGVLAQFKYFFGQEPGVALLLALLCLKQMESRSPRDIRAAILLCLFLQLGLFFYDQSIVTALLAIGGTLLALTTLTLLQYVPERPSAALRTAGTLLLQGLPFMLALFLLFPRIQGPLWALPNDAVGRTGLKDSMEPGSISELIQSGGIAFRVNFEGEPPPPNQRYWRGPVLSIFQGRSWHAIPPRTRRQPAYTVSGRRYDYRVTIEAHNENWLLAMDYPGAGIEKAGYAQDYQLLSRYPVRNRIRMDMNAYPETQPGLEESDIVLKQAVRLPGNVNPRTTEMIRQLINDSDTPEQRLNKVLSDMRSRRLVYTLQPPLLGQHSIDEFLFDTRQGFCEHFASAFAFMMRRAGVPARVVIGYQGGEINPVDGTMVIRQSDAHAWNEVWLPSRGWLRVDPTAISAPERIEDGLAGSLTSGLPFLLHPSMAWLNTLRYQWEALSNSWNQWVLGFDVEQQHRLLERLGISAPNWKKMALLMGVVLSILSMLLLGWALYQNRRGDALDHAWQRFCDKLAQRGLPRQSWEGPMDYIERAAAALPAHADALRDIASTYARLRYGRRGNDNDSLVTSQIHALSQRIRELKLK